MEPRAADGDRITRLQQLYTSLLKAKDRDVQQLRQQMQGLRAQVDVCRDQLQTLEHLLAEVGVPATTVQATLGPPRRRPFDLAVFKQRLTQVPWARVLAHTADPGTVVWQVLAWALEVESLHPRTTPLVWSAPDTFKVYAPPPGGPDVGPQAWRPVGWLELLGPVMRHCDDALTNAAAGAGAAGPRTLRENNRTLLLQLQRLLDEHMERRGLVERVPVDLWDTPLPAPAPASAPAPGTGSATGTRPR